MFPLGEGAEQKDVGKRFLRPREMVERDGELGWRGLRRPVVEEYVQV